MKAIVYDRNTYNLLFLNRLPDHLKYTQNNKCNVFVITNFKKLLILSNIELAIKTVLLDQFFQLYERVIKNKKHLLS